MTLYIQSLRDCWRRGSVSDRLWLGKYFSCSVAVLAKLFAVIADASDAWIAMPLASFTVMRYGNI